MQTKRQGVRLMISCPPWRPGKRKDYTNTKEASPTLTGGERDTATHAHKREWDIKGEAASLREIPVWSVVHHRS